MLLLGVVVVGGTHLYQNTSKKLQYEYKYDKKQAPATVHCPASTARFVFQACGLFSGHAQLGVLSVFQVPGLSRASCTGFQRQYTDVLLVLILILRRTTLLVLAEVIVEDPRVHFEESHYEGKRLGPGAYLRGQTHVQ